MVISKKYKFIFIHIPKNAGTSLTSALNNLILEEKHWAVSKNTKHQTLKDLIDLKINASFFKKVAKDFNFISYYKFAIVRNPYERMISLYDYLKKTEIRKEICEIKDFNEFIEKLEDPHSWVSGLYSCKEQLSYVIDKNNNIAVDFIGKYENLEETIKQIEKKFLINLNLEHLNFSKSKDAVKINYYTKKTRKIVYNKFKNDFNVFNYIP